MTDFYARFHTNLQGPGDSRPTAEQIIDDEDLRGKLEGKTVLITGATAGIGLETAKALHLTGAELYLTTRNLQRARKALGAFGESPRVHLLEMDHLSLASVKRCAETFIAQSDKLDIMINNAGVMATPEGRSDDGHEIQFQTNHLSHFVLFELLRPTMIRSASPERASRVINLSSLGHRRGIPNINNLNLDGCYDKWRAYGASKTCNIWMANEIDRRYRDQGIRTFSVHPGGIVTGLWDHMTPEDVQVLRDGQGFDESLKSPQQGAATTVWGAVAKCLEGEGGRYLDDVQIASPWTDDQPFANPGWAPHAFDQEGAQQLWEKSLVMTESIRA